jgi:hypothetical protein
MPDDRRELVRLVANASVTGDGDPPSLTDHPQPLFVVAVGREVVAMPFYGEPAFDEDVRKVVAEIPVREEDVTQEARS